jgi:hypothetical protein
MATLQHQLAAGLAGRYDLERELGQESEDLCGLAR